MSSIRRMTSDFNISDSKHVIKNLKANIRFLSVSKKEKK